MDSPNLPFLLEDVLSGRPEDPRQHLQSTHKLHLQLKSSTSSTLQGASLILTELKSKKKVSPSDYSIFSNYLSNIKQSSAAPDLRHIPIITSGLKVATIFHALNKIQERAQSLKFSVFCGLKLSNLQVRNDLEIKRLQCARMAANVKKSLGIVLEKSLSLWDRNADLKDSAGKKSERKKFTNFQRDEKVFKGVKALVLGSPLAFEQQALWRWSIIAKEAKKWEDRVRKGVGITEKSYLMSQKREGFIRLRDFKVKKWQMGKDVMAKVLSKAELRFFYVKKLKMEIIKSGFEVEEYWEEEEQERITRSRVTITSISPDKPNPGISKKGKKVLRSGKPASASREPELQNLLERITINSLNSEPNKVLSLLSPPEIRQNPSASSLIQYLSSQSTQKKALPSKLLSLWQSSLLVSSSQQARYLKSSNLLQKLIRARFTRLLVSLSLSSTSNEGSFEEIIEETIEETTQKICFRKSQKVIESLSFIEKSQGLALDAASLYPRALLSSVLKHRKFRVKEAFMRWAFEARAIAEARDLDNEEFFESEIIEETIEETNQKICFRKSQKTLETLSSIENSQGLVLDPATLYPRALLSSVLKHGKFRAKEAIMRWAFRAKAMAEAHDFDTEEFFEEEIIEETTEKTIQRKVRRTSDSSGYIERTQREAIDPEGMYSKALLGSVLKYSKIRQKEAFMRWVAKTEVESQKRIKFQLESFASRLNSGLLKMVKPCLFVKSFRNKEREYKGKIEEYLLKNLAKYPKLNLMSFFYKWKAVKKNNSRVMLMMISVLQRIFAQKGKRVFNPPRIIKDADQIMRRTIRKLTYVKDWGLKIGILRWKQFDAIQRGQADRKSLFNLLYLLSNPTKTAFSRWKSRAFARDCIKRVEGTGKIISALKKIFKSRYDSLVRKSLLTKKRPRVLNPIWRKYCAKYLENLRIAMLRLKDTSQIKEAIDMNAGKALKVVQIAERFRKIAKKAFNAWGKYKEGCRRSEIHLSLKSLKILYCFQRILRRRFSIVKRFILPSIRSMQAIQKLVSSYTNKGKSAFIQWKATTEASKTNKSLDKLKSTRLKQILLILSRANLQAAKDNLIGNDKKTKRSIKLISKHLYSHPRQAFSLLKTHVSDSKLVKKIRASLNFSVIFRRILLKRVIKVTKRCFNIKDKLKIGLKTAAHLAKDRIRALFGYWRNMNHENRMSSIISPLRALTLEKMLRKCLAHTLAYPVHRMLYNNNHLKSTITRIFSAVKKRPINALRKWIKFSTETDIKFLLGRIQSNKLKIALTKLPLRTILTTFSLVTNRKFNKSRVPAHTISSLKSCLLYPLVRSLRLAFVHLTAIPLKKPLLFRAFSRILKKPRSAITKWQYYSESLNKNLIFNAYRAEKLRSTLERIIQKALKSTCNPLLQIEKKMKSAMKGVISKLRNKPKWVIRLWRMYAKDYQTFEAERSSCSRLLQIKLCNILRKRVRDVLKRLDDHGIKAKAAILAMFIRAKRKPLSAVQKWEDYAREIERKKLISEVNGQKIKIWGLRVARRTMLTAVVRSTGRWERADAALKCLELALNKRKSDAWEKWRIMIENCKKFEIFNRLRSQKLKNFISRIANRVTKGVEERLCSRRSLGKIAIKAIIEVCKNTPRNAIQAWKHWVNELNQDQLIKKLTSERLCVYIEKVIKRTSRSNFERLTGYRHKTIKAIQTIIDLISKSKRQSLQKWRDIIKNKDRDQLIKNVRSLKLAKILAKIPNRSLKDCFERTLGIGHKIKLGIIAILKSLIQHERTAFSRWTCFIKETNLRRFESNSLKLKGLALKELLSKPYKRTLRAGKARIDNDSQKMRLLLKVLSKTCDRLHKNEFIKWKSGADAFILCRKSKGRRLTESLAKLSLKQARNILNQLKTPQFGINSCIKGLKLHRCLYSATKRSLCLTLKTIRFFRDPRKLIGYLLNNNKIVKITAFKRLWGRVEKIRTIRKINSAYFVFRTLLQYSKKLQQSRFTYWKNLEFLRRRRIIRKSLTKMIFFVAVRYESGFWKWKYIKTHTNYQVTPKHSLAFKRFILIGTNYQKRLEQYSFYKIALYFRAMISGGRMSLPLAVAHFTRGSRDFSVSDVDRPPSTAMDLSKSITNLFEFNKSADHPSNASTVINKLTKEETNHLNYTGAFEVLNMQIKAACARRVCWALWLISAHISQDNEKQQLIRKLNELSEELKTLKAAA